MTDEFDSAIARLQTKLREQEQSVTKTKTLINFLCEEGGKPPMFREAELQASSAVSLSIRGDQFYGQPLASCIREILEMRKKLNQGPATVNEIYAALTDGNYQFGTRDETNAKRGLRESLSKNNVTFHKLPDGKFGLLEWYPKPPKRKGTDTDASTGADEPQVQTVSANGGKGGVP